MWITVALAAVGFWLAWSRALSASVTSRVFDAPNPSDDVMTGYHPFVNDLAIAIANAEGYGKAGAIPTRANNPGDLVIPGWDGETLGAEGISVFATAEEGWDRLHRQLQRIVDGRSQNYSMDMTIGEMARKWTATEQDAWASNVVEYLRRHGHGSVTADTPLADLL